VHLNSDVHVHRILIEIGLFLEGACPYLYHPNASSRGSDSFKQPRGSSLVRPQDIDVDIVQTGPLHGRVRVTVIGAHCSVVWREDADITAASVRAAIASGGFRARQSGGGAYGPGKRRSRRQRIPPSSGRRPVEKQLRT
jgi:hypothetical protein